MTGLAFFAFDDVPLYLPHSYHTGTFYILRSFLFFLSFEWPVGFVKTLHNNRS